MAVRSTMLIMADTLADVANVDTSAPVVFCLETGRFRFKNGSWGDCLSNELAVIGQMGLRNGANGYPGLDGGSKLAFSQVPVGTSGANVCVGNDARLADSRAPNGVAGGDLAGSYPSPVVKNGVVLTTPNIGAATGTSLAASGAVTAAAGMGYAAGSGGVVTQATSKSTGVSLNKPSGQITMNAAALAAGAIVSFTLTDSAIGATDVLIPNHVSGGTLGAYTINTQCNAGSCVFFVRNATAASLSEAIVIRFALVKGAIS